MSEQRILTTKGTERVLDDSVIDKFAAGLRGDLLRPSDRAYDTVRKVWNGMVDKRPALIARCAGTADVVDCVRLAREHDLLVSVRGGGHNYAGKSVCEGGLMIDLRPMKGIYVDPAGRTARAQAGVDLGEFDRETQAFGLATTLGVATDTGVAGLTLGGGYGWLGGKYGLACDNLLSAEVVTADGSVVTASAVQNEELFWGLRGAGANLGIATSLEFQLHEVGAVLGGIVIYPITIGKEALRFYDEFAATCPDEVTTVISVMVAPDGDPAVSIIACHCGPRDEGERILKPLRTLAPPLGDTFAPMTYLQMQNMYEGALPSGRLYYNKSSIARRLEPAINTFLELAHTMPTPLYSIGCQQLHGAAGRVGVSETAFPHRYDHFTVWVNPATDDPAESEGMVRWGRDAWERIQPFVERAAVYVNALEDSLDEGEHRVAEAYGPNYKRLVAVKEKYDPTNFFRLNANIKPPAGAA